MNSLKPHLPNALFKTTPHTQSIIILRQYNYSTSCCMHVRTPPPPVACRKYPLCSQSTPSQKKVIPVARRKYPLCSQSTPSQKKSPLLHVKSTPSARKAPPLKKSHPCCTSKVPPLLEKHPLSKKSHPCCMTKSTPSQKKEVILAVSTSHRLTPPGANASSSSSSE